MMRCRRQKRTGWLRSAYPGRQGDDISPPEATQTGHIRARPGPDTNAARRLEDRDRGLLAARRGSSSPRGAARDPVLIQVGPARASGGISDVMRAIDGWSHASGRVTVLVNTSCDGSVLRRAGVGVAGVLRAAWAILTTPRSLVHVHAASNGSFLRKSVVVLTARLTGRPILLHIHGGGFSAFATGGSRLRRSWVSAVLRRADAVCVVSEQVKQAVHQLEPEVPISVLPNPATLLCGRLTDSRQRRVLFLGRLGLTKGTDVLLTAIRLLQSADVAAPFVLAGDGGVEGTRAAVLRLPTPSCVQVPGWVDEVDVHRLLHESSVFCLPSRYEGLPMALLQAMGHGLACVVTPVGGMGEVVIDGVSGLVVPQDDPESLAVAVGALLEDSDLRACLGRRAAHDIERSYSPEIVMRRLDAIYSALLADRGRRAFA